MKCRLISGDSDLDSEESDFSDSDRDIYNSHRYIYYRENMHVINSIMLTIKAEFDSDFLVPNFTGNATEISNPLGIGGTRKLR